MITITANDGIDFSKFYAAIVTGSDSVTGVTTSATLIMNNH